MFIRETFKPLDAVLVAVIITVALLWSHTDSHRGGSVAEAVVVVTGSTCDTISLFRDTTIKTDDLTIEIRAGRAAIVQSDCSTQQCVHTGWISSPGEMAACVPNRTLIEILGSQKNTDAITY